jgi:hypothetical protein
MPVKSVVFLTAMILCNSCSTISYVPKVNLDISPKTINKTVQVEKLIDSTPSGYKKNLFLRPSVTNRKSLSSDLNLEVTNAIVSDFAVNGLFKQVSGKVDNPDFVIKGEIKKFVGKSELNTFGKVSYFGTLTTIIIVSSAGTPIVGLGIAPFLGWFTGIPISKNTSEIEIIM